MSSETGISWTATHHPDGTTTKGATWNFVVGCERISPGCQRCYARSLHNSRHAAKQAGKDIRAAQYDQPFEAVQLLPGRLHDPLRWGRPRKIFVCSMSDAFHEQVPWALLDQACAVMLLAPRHTFQMLTKRAARMHAYFTDPARPARLEAAVTGLARSARIPLADGQARALAHSVPENLWLGVTAEHQATADERIPLLLEIPAAVHFLSCEPLIGPVNLQRWLSFSHCEEELHPEKFGCDEEHPACQGCEGRGRHRESECHATLLSAIGWVIVGGESGQGARPMQEVWALDLRDQCEAAEIPFHFKQWGVHDQAGQPSAHPRGWPHRTLRGRMHDAFPPERGDG